MTQETSPRSLVRDAAALAGFLVLCFAISGLGAWVTSTSVDTWYQTLNKPSFNPPAWVFAPVWTTLYIFMAIAGWLVWRKVGFGQARQAFVCYFLQLALNLVWSFLFFGAQSPGAAFIEVLVFLIAIIMTATHFSRFDRIATLLFAPYIAWVAFASVLNGTIWYLNG